MNDHVDFEAINLAASRNGRWLVQELIPGGKLRGLEYVVLNPTRYDKQPGSFSINYTTGQWSDFATNDRGGDFVSLVAYLHGCRQVDAARELAAKLGLTDPSDRYRGPQYSPETIRCSNGARAFPFGDEGPSAQSGEVRRHFYKNGAGISARIKIKFDSGSWTNWYRLFDGAKPVGWQPKKPDGYEPVPYVTAALDPFDPELDGDQLFWPEGEKDVDTLSKLNLPAFTFGGVGDGLPPGIEHYLMNRHVVILADNDDPGGKHAEKKAELAERAKAASIRIIYFPELPAKGDVSDFIANNGTVEGINARINDAPLWVATESAQTNAPLVPSSDSTWESPSREILEDGRGTLSEFPTDVFDDRWRDYIKRAAHGAGVTDAHVAVPLIGVISGVIGCSYRVKAASAWLEPCALWSAVVGYSGTGKTPGIDVSKRALAFLEKQRCTKIAALQREHETKAEVARAAQKQWEQQVKKAIEDGNPAPQRPAAATDMGVFIRPRLYLSDATVERLAVLLQGRPSGLVSIYDELSGLFSNMARYKNGSDREFWLESWNGKHFVVERQGRGPVTLDHLLVALVGGLQPDKLARCFQGDNDGMYARICFSWPSEPPYRPLSHECAENDPVIINALDRLLEELPVKTDDGEFVSVDIPLSKDGSLSFEDFRQFLHAEKDCRYGREREWLLKGPSQVLRLAGTLAFMSWAGSAGTPKLEQIERKHLEAAIRIWRDYFWPHSRAALRQIGLADDDAPARRVLKWIRANKAAERIVSLMEVRREAMNQSLNAKQTRGVLQRLEQDSWLRKETTPTRGRPRERWRVNDRLFDIHAKSAGSAETVQS